MKLCLIRQPAGIGDIFFTQKIARKILSHGKCSKVLWPVIKEFNYLHDYMGTNDIEYIDECNDFPFKHIYESPLNVLYEDDDVLYVPLQHSDQTTLHSDPRAHGHIKYKFSNNLSYHDWVDYFNFGRDLARENILVDDLGIDLTQKYNFINRNFGSPPNSKQREDIVPNNSYPNIYMEIQSKYHIFDWLTVIENAHEIHTVETSLYYLLEKIKLENVFIYSKHTISGGYDDFMYMKPHCSKQWTYVR